MGVGSLEENDGRSRIVRFPGVPSGPARIEAIFRDHEKRLLQFLRIRLGSEAEAQDAAQLTFLRLWQRRDALLDDNLVALMFVTARNISTDILRQRKRSYSLAPSSDSAFGDTAQIPDAEPGPDRSIAARQDLSLILKLVDELPAKCRTAFVSCKFHNLDYPEIAARMGVTESMVRKYVLKAVVHCTKRFEQLEGWE